ncbi:MAG: hypothetical protein ACO4AI_07730 [Prochlorothrix sp.]
MTQNFLELAKKGDPRVLAGLINRALQKQGIAVKATQRGEITHFLFECSQDIPEPTALTDYLLQALTRLKAPPLSLLLSVRSEGQREVAWQRRLSFNPQAGEPGDGLPPPPPPAKSNGSGGTMGEATANGSGALNGYGAANVAIAEQNPGAETTAGANPDLNTADWDNDDSALGFEAATDLDPEDTTQLWEDEDSDAPGSFDSLEMVEEDEDARPADGPGDGPGDEAEANVEASDSGITLEELALDELDAEAGAEVGTEVEQQRSMSLYPVVAAAAITILFALAGVAYRFFYYPNQQADIDPPGTVTNPPDTPDNPGATAVGNGGAVPIATPAPEVFPPETDLPGNSTGNTSGSDPEAGMGTMGTDGSGTGESGPGEMGTGEMGMGGTPPEGPVATEPDRFDPSSLPPVAEVANPWYEGVTLAIEAAELTQEATSAEDWDNIAARWERAVELMQAVPATDPNYAQAQERIFTYDDNLNYARQNAGY